MSINVNILKYVAIRRRQKPQQEWADYFNTPNKPDHVPDGAVLQFNSPCVIDELNSEYHNKIRVWSEPPFVSVTPGTRTRSRRRRRKQNKTKNDFGD